MHSVVGECGRIPVYPYRCSVFVGSLLRVATGLSLFSLWALRGIGFVGDHSKIQKWKAFCKTGGNKRNVSIKSVKNLENCVQWTNIWICLNNWCYTIGVSGPCLGPHVQAEPAWSLGSVAAHAQGWRKTASEIGSKMGHKPFLNYTTFDILV